MKTQDPRLQRRTGIALVVASAVAWSTSGLFTRLLHLDPWTIVFWRGLFGGAFIVLFLFVIERRAGIHNLLRMKPNGWLVACLTTLAAVTFISGLQFTSVANVSIIIGAQPFAAAAVAWIWFRETVCLRTLVASAVTLIGITLVVIGAGSIDDYRGILLACCMMLAVATMTVAIRRHRETSMVAAAAMSNFLGCLVSLPFARDLGSPTQADIAVLALFGLFSVAMGLTFLSLGSRLLPSGQTALIATLETPLMPFWVWLVFHEIPTPRAIIGGLLVTGAVVVDILATDTAAKQSIAIDPASRRSM
jgi:drug/metabolite transporter (DMT)-like permease